MPLVKWDEPFSEAPFPALYYQKCVTHPFLNGHHSLRVTTQGGDGLAHPDGRADRWNESRAVLCGATSSLRAERATGLRNGT